MKRSVEKPAFTRAEMEITPYDTAEFLDGEEDIAEYLAVSLEDPDPDIFLRALGNVLRTKGVANASRQTGLAREALYRTCRPGKKPHFDTIIKITRAIGIPLGFPASATAKKKATPYKTPGNLHAAKPRLTGAHP